MLVLKLFTVDLAANFHFSSDGTWSPVTRENFPNFPKKKLHPVQNFPTFTVLSLANTSEILLIKVEDVIGLYSRGARNNNINNNKNKTRLV